MNSPFLTTFQKTKQYVAQSTFIQVKKGNWTWYTFLLASFIFCYATIIGSLTRTWWNNDVYTHGFIVPIVSLYIIWIRKERLRDILISHNYFLGGLVFGSAIFILIIGHVSGVLLVQQLSILLLIAGIILLLFGMRILGAIWFPIIYLSLMFPFLRILKDSFHFPFQVFSARFATIMLQMINIPSICYINYIELPNITLEVAPGCSGVNYLISVIAVGLPLAYFTLHNWYRRLILISGAIIIAIVTNGIRVFLIGVFSYYGINSILHGPYHIFQALFVGIMGYIALFIGAFFLSQRDRSLSLKPPKSSQISKSYICRDMEHFQVEKYLIIFVSATLIIVGSFINFYKFSIVPLKVDIRLFPSEIGEWKGMDVKPDYELFRLMSFDDELSRAYRNRKTGEEVKLYIGYHGFQKQGKELVSYKSRMFHTGVSKTKIILQPDKSIEVNKVIKREGNTYRLILFWYDLDGRFATDEIKVKAYTAWNAISKQYTNGTIVMVTSDFYGGAKTEDILKHSEDFIKELLPVLHIYIY